MRAQLEIRLRATGADLFVVEVWQQFSWRERARLLTTRAGRHTLRALGPHAEWQISETPPIPRAHVDRQFMRAFADYAGDPLTMCWRFTGEDRMKIDPDQVVKDFQRSRKLLKAVK